MDDRRSVVSWKKKKTDKQIERETETVKQTDRQREQRWGQTDRSIDRETDGMKIYITFMH